MNKKNVLTIIVAIIALISIYCIYTYYIANNNQTTQPDLTPNSNIAPTPLTSTTTTSPTDTPTPTPTNITVVDGLGNNVTITLPVNRVVSINYGITEIICALGCQNLIVGRDELSISPPSVTSISIVASSSYAPNMELLLTSKPDLILADSMLGSKEQELAMIQTAGIPVYIENTGNFSRILECIDNMGCILGKEQAADELHDFLTQYQLLAANRVADLLPSQKVNVYLEWTSDWQTATHPSIVGLMIAAGGLNIAEGGLSSSMSYVSPEYVVEANPDVILKVVGGTSYDISQLQSQRDYIIGRQVLSDTNAVKNERVYAYYNIITQGIRYPIGLLYCEKWLYPDLLSDVDPNAVQAELYQRFFGITLEDVYTYP